jgi:hypothetical protein
MKYDLVLHVIWITGTQMIQQETDGLSQGEEMRPAIQGSSLAGIILLHLGALEQSPQVLEWIHSWAGVLYLESPSPEGWYTNSHKQGNFLCPPPAAAVEKLWEAAHISPQCTHIFMMTHNLLW